jgi:hypothetical protein
VPFADDGLLSIGILPPSTPWEIPALDHLFARNTLNVALDQLLGNPLPAVDSRQTLLRCLNLVRLTDLAIRSYERGRELLADFAAHGQDGKVSPFFDAVDAFEATVIALYRATRVARDLTATHADIALPSARAFRQLDGLRNAVMHMDGRLKASSASDGRIVHMLYPLPTELFIGQKDRLSYANLADMITMMFRNVEMVRGVPST